MCYNISVVIQVLQSLEVICLDALDVVLNKDQVIPYFQPIISADEQVVIGYEVLARIKTNEGVKSLGWFFRDKSIPEEYRQEIDDYLQTLALQKLLAQDEKIILFFNVDIELMFQDEDELFIKKYQQFAKEGIHSSRIVLEFKEEEIIGNVSQYKHFISYMKSLGFKIAIDGVGKHASNLEHIVQIKPDILKVDLSFIEGDSFLQMYRDVLYSITMLSRKIGATLLFQGINDFGQLNYAWRNGGRYYQGYYIGSPKENMGEEIIKLSLTKEFQHFINFEQKKIKAVYELSEKLEQRLKEIVKPIKNIDNVDDFLLKIAEKMDEFAFRLYVCDQNGFQISANVQKNDEGNWMTEAEGRHKNWSWRPYFLENIFRMNIEQKGILSDLYTDIEKDEIIRTYSYPIDQDLYIFIDIPYQYLFEQEGLL